ncbi:unnamed protein product [Coffea canephora]|uniref:Ribose-5-phosphate isomerase n=1 Tax=Coffea canephora TaxID=49390 RepID=A0A068UU08_COFCA|nr:unnamed protein product [Coffea canephora]
MPMAATTTITILFFLSSHHNASTRLFLRPSASAAFHSSSRPSFSIKSLSTTLTQDDLKKLTADKAAQYVKSRMALGLGTGSTAIFVVAKLGELLATWTLSESPPQNEPKNRWLL